MASQIKLRRGTATQWTSANPTLAEGEAGFEVDTNKLKVGDGINAWNSLEYLTSSASVDFSDYLTISSASTTYLTQTSASTTYATKDNASITSGLTLESYADINLSNNSRIWPNNGGLYIQSDGDISLAYSPSVVLPENTSIGNVTSTEIGYLDGVTSNIQTQINGLSGGSSGSLAYLANYIYSTSSIPDGVTTILTTSDLSVGVWQLFYTQSVRVTGGLGNEMALNITPGTASFTRLSPINYSFYPPLNTTTHTHGVLLNVTSPGNIKLEVYNNGLTMTSWNPGGGDGIGYYAIKIA